MRATKKVPAKATKKAPKAEAKKVSTKPVEIKKVPKAKKPAFNEEKAMEEVKEQHEEAVLAQEIAGEATLENAPEEFPVQEFAEQEEVEQDSSTETEAEGLAEEEFEKARYTELMDALSGLPVSFEFADRPAHDPKPAPVSTEDKGTFGRLADHRKKFEKIKMEVNGKKTVKTDCGDALAAKLREMNLIDVYVYASETLGIPEADLMDRYCKLNPGQQRMNLGNRLRAYFKKNPEAWS